MVPCFGVVLESGRWLVPSAWASSQSLPLRRSGIGWGQFQLPLIGVSFYVRSTNHGRGTCVHQIG
jgi:hypothetical protein